jgi:predicted aldo/keto reductase-like oxidoreductase
VDWALRFLWDRPEVSVVLSGMSSRQQVVGNCASTEKSGVNSLTPNDHVMFQEIAAVFRRGMPVQYTGCGYCEPCPARVSIPCNFALANNMVAGSSSVMDFVFRRQIKRNYKG